MTDEDVGWCGKSWIENQVLVGVCALAGYMKVQGGVFG